MLHVGTISSSVSGSTGVVGVYETPKGALRLAGRRLTPFWKQLFEDDVTFPSVFAKRNVTG